MNYRRWRILIFGICQGFVGSIGSQSAHSQQTSESPTIIDYLNRRLSEVRKQVQLDGQKFDAKLNMEALCPIYARDAALQYVAGKVLMEYGAVFVGDNNVFLNFELLSNNNSVRLVSQCIFFDDAGVRGYQSRVKTRREIMGGSTIELEEDAMTALMEARKQAATKGLNITPRGGSIAARRSYADTQRLWDSRFYSGLRHWAGKKISQREVAEVKLLNTIEQAARILEWEEKRKAFFSTDFTKSILYSVASPGTSQHLFMLAIDIDQFYRKEVRSILASQGWYQTVKSDLPHFTYLGIKEKSELTKRGLKSEEVGGYEFWTPKID